MTAPISIPGAMAHSVGASVSPGATTGSLHDRYARRRDTIDNGRSKVLHPVDNENLRLLILENISQDAVAAFRTQGYTVDHYTKAMSEDELVQKIGDYHAIGIRSKTKITARVLQAARKVNT
jgi:D-3-phosphoglycerate dehydrogenase / 2-oxoglutarate reductase